MSEEDFYEKLRILQKGSDKAIDQVQEVFFESLKKALSDYLSEQQINELLEDFKHPFDQLRATMRRHWDTEITEGLGQRSIYGE